MTVGLIGYGRFGRFAVPHIARTCTLVVHDPRRDTSDTLPRGAEFGSFAEAAKQKIVVVAVPVSSMQSVLRRMRPLLRPGTLVVDVCAVKEEPVRWMKRILPAQVDILATHPLFGPDSAAKSLKGKTVVLCPVRISRPRLRTAIALLKRAGLRTMILTPREHDSLMAETIFLTQFLGRLVVSSALRRRPPVTGNYAGILALVDTVRHDTPRLFADMAGYSRETRRVMRSLGRAFATIQRQIGPGRR